MSDDPIRAAIQTVRDECECDCTPCLTGAVKAAVATVLDAEHAEWDANKDWERDDVPFVLGSLRATFGITPDP